MIISVCCMRRIGIPHCPKCGKEIKKQTVDQMVDQIMELPERTKIQLLAPVVRGRKGEHAEALRAGQKRSGYVRVRVDGNLYELSEEIKLEKNKKHNIEIVVDRLVVKPGIEKRLTDSLENVLRLADGLADGGCDRRRTDAVSARAFPARTAESASMRSSREAFPSIIRLAPARTAIGLGYKMEFDEDLMIPDKSSEYRRRSHPGDGLAVLYGSGAALPDAILDALAEEYGFDLDTPYQELSGGNPPYADPWNRRPGSEGALQRTARRRRLSMWLLKD